MGISELCTMRVSLACVALFAAAFIGAYTATSTEVEDLGAVDLSDAADHKMAPVDTGFEDDNDDDELGEGMGVGRGGFLSTQGSFTLSGGKEEDELGEGAGVGRGGFLSTQGSFTLSGGMGGGKGEEDELGEGAGVGRGGFLSTQGSFTLSGGMGGGKGEEW